MSGTAIRLRCLDLATRMTNDPARAPEIAETFRLYVSGMAPTRIQQLVDEAELRSDITSFGRDPSEGGQ